MSGDPPSELLQMGLETASPELSHQLLASVALNIEKQLELQERMIRKLLEESEVEEGSIADSTGVVHLQRPETEDVQDQSPPSPNRPVLSPTSALPRGPNRFPIKPRMPECINAGPRGGMYTQARSPDSQLPLDADFATA